MDKMEIKRELRVLDTEQVKEIYGTYMTEDFPESELPPLNVFLQRRERGIYECLGLYENEELRAYGYFTKNPERGYLLLDFLAVCPQYRSGGYGSSFLQLVREYYREANGILLECETERTAVCDEERSIRHRRIQFYLRNGCKMTDVFTVLFGVEFDILCLPIKEAAAQTDEEMKSLYRLMFGDKAETVAHTFVKTACQGETASL